MRKREAIGWRVWDMKTLIKGAFDSTLTRRSPRENRRINPCRPRLLDWRNPGKRAMTLLQGSPERRSSRS